MNDTERELREMFARRVGDAAEPPPSMPQRLGRRTRVRQVLIVATSIAAVTVLVLASLAAIGIVSNRDEAARPATNNVVLPDAPAGFQTAALPYASIAYPDGWYLLDTSPLLPMGAARPYIVPSGPVLQLANFDPDLPRAPKCMVDPDALPPDGVLLTVGIMTEEEAAISTPPSGPWPVELAALPSNMDPVCAGAPRIASWTLPSGLIYWATAGHGPHASDADIQALDRAFSSLQFPPTDRPQMSQMAAFQSQGTPRIVLGTETIGSSVAEIVAYVELNKSLLVGVSSSDAGSDCCLGGAFAPHSGSTDESVSSSVAISPSGTLVYGVISPDVARAELRTSDGEALPVSTAALPPSLGVDDRVVWGVAPGSDERATIVGYDADGSPIGNPTFPTEPEQVLATGENEGGMWTLSLTHGNTGWGLAFASGDGGAGGGGFGDLGDRIFYGAMSSGPSWSADSGVSTAPQELAGEVTDRAARAEFRLVDGSVIGASLYPVPEEAFGGGAQVYLLFVPSDVLVKAGEMVAYDGGGNELGRQYLDFSPVALFPKVLEQSSPEAVDAMKDLQLAGSVAGRYYQANDLSWQGFDPTTASEISDAVVYNTSDTAVTGEVSIRAVSRDALVLATRAANGEIFSVCMQGGAGGTYGRNDTSDPGACTNGWLDPPG